MMTVAERKRVVRFALTAIYARADGKTTIVLGEGKAQQTLLLRAVYTEEGMVQGYCARFVRQIHETALGLAPKSWKYAAASARGITEKLDPYLVKIPARQPGDIVGIHRRSGKYGHVGIYLGMVDGKEVIAENTSSGKRGWPGKAGTKMTRWSELESRVTGVYRP